MKKILMVGMTCGYGGIESFIMNVFHELKDSFEIDFVKTDEKIAYEEDILKYSRKIYKVTPRSVNPLQYQKDLDQIFKQNHYDIVWLNRCSLSSITELAMAKKNGVKVRIIHAHSSQNTGGKVTFMMHTLNKLRIRKIATHFFSCSDSASTFFYTETSDVKVISNGINVRNYLFDENKRKMMKEQLKISQDDIVFGHVGRFVELKNQTFLLDVIAELKQEMPNIKLVFCGDGPELEKCKLKAKRLGINNDVMFLGQRKDVPDVLQSIDFFLFPSLFEGLPFALIEAQMASCYVLFSDTITKETIICKHAEQLPIHDAKLWVNRIMDLKTYKKAREESFLNSTYSITNTCQMLKEFLNKELQGE